MPVAPLKNCKSIYFRLFPVLVGVLHEHGVVVLGIASDLLAKPGRLVESVILVGELDLGDSQAVVVAIELIHLPSVLAVSILDKITCLVNDSRLGEIQKSLDLVNRNLLLPLETRGPGGVAYALYGDESLVTFYPDTHSPLGNAAEVALGDTCGLEGLILEVSFNQEFFLYFLSHILTRSLKVYLSCQ